MRFIKKAKACAGVVAAVLLCPRATSAQPPEPAGDLKIPVLAWSAAVAADWTTTYRFTSQYRDVLHETNPLIRGLDTHPAWLVTAGASIDAATVWAAYRFLGRDHPRLMRVALYGAAAYRTYLTVYNVRMMREADAVRSVAPR
jgi:hypothetical protein